MPINGNNTGQLNSDAGWAASRETQHHLDGFMDLIYRSDLLIYGSDLLIYGWI